ncbi:MAG: hypothetical protein JWN70_7152 [Planctomycetaceae bacterium]|nr:hypothetical protein [Planctomycetaceae bacterium]
MAFEPINVFSRRIDPRGVISAIRALGLEVQLTGPDDDWEQVVVLGPKKLLRKRLTLTLTHDANYYDGPNWSSNVLGMRNYFGGFPEVPRKGQILDAVSRFRFAIAVNQEDLDIDSRDERLPWLQAVCSHIDGVIFTPSSLRDSAGRILIGAGGHADPLAVLPQAPPIVETDSGDGQSENEEEDEPEPPSADRVLRRAMALAAVTNRAFMELDEEPQEELEELRQELLAWIEEAGISAEIEPDEWEILQIPVGAVPEQSTINAIWRLEGLGVLAWALKLYPLVVYDELVKTAELQEAVGIYDTERTQELLARPELRTPEELEHVRRQLLAFNWRMVNFRVHPGAMDFVEFSKNCWFGSFDISPFRIIKQDLAIGSAAISNADPRSIDRCNSAARERHQAINWLSGYAAIYSEIDTST